MAIRVAVHRTCDRCAHPFDESSVEYGKPLPQFEKRTLQANLIRGEANAEVLFRFEDLCPDCDRVVEGYIKKIRMDAEEDVPKRRKNKNERVEEKPSEELKSPEAESKPTVEAPPAEVIEKPAEETKASAKNPLPF
jgi:hypothetical protein